MGLYEVPLFVSVGFWDRDYVSQLPCVGYYVFVPSPRGPMCFSCLIFNLSGPGELLFFTVVMSDDDVCCSVVFVFSVI